MKKSASIVTKGNFKLIWDDKIRSAAQKILLKKGKDFYKLRQFVI